MVNSEGHRRRADLRLRRSNLSITLITSHDKHTHTFYYITTIKSTNFGHLIYAFFLTISLMKKNAPLAFRIPSELKKTIQHIADREARSISQICEILLTVGAESYQKEGSRYLQRFLDKEKAV